MPKRKLSVTPPSPRAAPGSRDSNEKSRPSSKQGEQQEGRFIHNSLSMDGSSFGRPEASRSGPSGSNSTRQGGSNSNSYHFEQWGRPGKKVFDVFSWYPNYQSCQRYFLEVAQFDYACQALAAFLNIKLPYQRLSAADFKHYQLASNNVRSGIGLPPPYRMGFPPQPPAPQHIPPLPGQQGVHLQSVDHLSFGNVSLLPYIRRLVVTGYDADGIMHGWFGDDWMSGLNPLLESERQNYMFAAKSSDWLTLKKSYDTVTEESVPFMVPLQRCSEAEIVRAEDAWSSTLSMRDWTIGPRSLDEDGEQ